MKDNLDFVKDDELKLFLERDYEAKLETSLAETDVGKRISALQKMGINVSIKQIASKYIEKNGKEFDEVGNILVDMTSVNGIYVETLETISKQIGFNITDFHIDSAESLDAIRKVEVKEPESVVEDIAEKIEIINEIINESKERNFDEYILDTSDINKILQIINDGSLTNEEIKEATQRHEESLVKNNIENENDITLIENIYNIRMINAPEYDWISKENKEILIKKYLEEVKKIAPGSKFAERLKDENGEITSESLDKFLNEFEHQRNVDDLFNKASKYAAYDATQIDDETRKKILKVFLRAERSEDKETRLLAKLMAERLGFDVITNGALNRNKIEKMCEKEFPGQTPDQIIEDAELNYKTAPREIAQIQNSIKDCGECEGKNRSDILKYREKSSKVQKRICGEKEKNIYDVLNSFNAGYINKNEYSKDKYVKIVVALYCKFREEEISANNDSFKGLSYQSFNREVEGSNSSIVRKFMQENSKYFEKYLKDIEKVDSKAALEMLKNDGLSKSEFNEYLIAYKQITSRTDKIKKKEIDNANKMDAIKGKLKEFYEKRDNEGIIDTELQNEIFKSCKDIPSEVFSTEMLTKLQGLDSEKFKETFKKSDSIRAIGQNTGKSIYFAAAKAFTYIPMLIHAASTKGIMKAFLPTIKKAQERLQKLKYESPEMTIIELEEEPKGIKKFMNKIFGKKDKKMLEEGKTTTEPQREQKDDKKIGKDSDFIQSNYGAVVDEKKAIEALATSEQGTKKESNIEKDI